jgi:glycine/D-amino acid oxidase-like deaminating enzyme
MDMFLFNDQSPVTFTDSLPEEADVVIIGAGVIGISTAWYLLTQGLSVLVLDKGRVAGEQSSRNWGWVRVTGRDEDEVPIALDSVDCWESISAEIEGDTGFTRQGVLILAHSEEEMAEFEDWMQIAKKYGVDTRLFSPKELGQHISLSSDGWHGGMVTPRDARAEPFLAVPAIARAVQKKGGLVRESCAVRSLDIEAGKISGVVTEQGRVKCQTVLCAAGAWSNLFLSNSGISLPQLAVKGTVVRTAKSPEVFAGAAGLHDIYIRRRRDGGYTVASGMTEHAIGTNSFRYMMKFRPSLDTASDLRLSLGGDVTQPSLLGSKWNADQKSPFETHRVLNPAPSDNALRLIRKNFDRRLPELAGLEFVESWAGMIDATPDVVPVMDQVSSCQGLYLATGFSGHGFGIGPGAGRVMADMITGKDARFDLTRFRFSRFSDGSKMVPGPAI